MLKNKIIIVTINSVSRIFFIKVFFREKKLLRLLPVKPDFMACDVINSICEGFSG